MRIPRLMVAGTHSGSGKTTLSLALMAVFSRRGLAVQPFKVGPDYIDPSLHYKATGRVSRNLDAWMLPEEILRDLFRRHAPEGPDGISLIEGVMGLFDGAGRTALAGSAHVAALLDAPVLLVVNAEGMALSAAALASGFAAFRPRTLPAAEARPGQSEPDLTALNVAGIVFNRVSGASHANLLKTALEEQTGLPCLGCLPKNAAPALPSRHLGLVPADELENLDNLLVTLADLAEEHLDIPALLRLAASAPPPKPGHPPRLPRPEPKAPRLRLGLARDAAFSFYYQDNLDLLETMDADIVCFSPLRDERLPENLDGLYLGGGFPEIFAAELEANRSLRADLLGALESGLPAYAECGGMLYLCRSLALAPENEGDTAREFAMTGFFPHRAEMTNSLQPFGYVSATLHQDCLLGRLGDTFRAHEFHYSRLVDDGDLPFRVMSVAKPDGRTWTGGLVKKNVFAAYPHLHWLGCPQAAASFLDGCRAFARQRDRV